MYDHGSSLSPDACGCLFWDDGVSQHSARVDDALRRRLPLARAHHLLHLGAAARVAARDGEAAGVAPRQRIRHDAGRLARPPAVQQRFALRPQKVTAGSAGDDELIQLTPRLPRVGRLLEPAAGLERGFASKLLFMVNSHFIHWQRVRHGAGRLA